MKLIRVLTTLLLLLLFKANIFAQYNFNKFLSDAKKEIADSNYTEAIKKLNICIQVEPANNSAYFYRAICKYYLYDDLGAEQDYTTALSSYGPEYYDALHDRSLVRYRMGNYAGAIGDMNKVIEKEPGNPKLYVERGFDLLANNDFNGALSDCKKAIQLKWAGSDLFLCKAAAEDALADYDDALCDYDEAIKINPANAAVYVRRGMTKYKMDNIRGAIDDYNAAIKIDSSSTLAYFNRAEAELKLEETKQALADYNLVLNYEPRNAYAYFNRAVLYSNIKKNKEAIADFDKVLLLNPENIKAIFNRAKLKQEDHDFKGAMTDYDRVIEMYPYFTEAYFNRAQLKYSMRNAAGADKDMELGKVMGDVFHSKSHVQLSRDSVLLVNLFRLSAEFKDASSAKEDTVNAGFLPLFYIAESDPAVPRHAAFDPLLEPLNRKKQHAFYFSNQSFSVSSSGDDGNPTAKNDSARLSLNQAGELLPVAIQLTNRLLLNKAREYDDKIINADATNPMAYFARALNTCREIEMMNSSNEPSILSGTSHTAGLNEKNEKCISALADFTKSIQLSPRFTFAYYDRANLKCILQDYEGALKDYETAVKINPDFAEACFNKGLLLYYLGNRQQACSDFSKAGELGVRESYSMMKRYCQQ